MSVPKVPKPDQAATFACAKNKEGPKPGSMFSFSAWSRTATRASTLKSANWRPLSLCTLNGLGVLCLEMCHRRFATLLRALNGVSNEYLVRTVFFEDKSVR